MKAVFRTFVRTALSLLFLMRLANSTFAQSGNMAVYTDSLQNGWQDWGWAPHNYTNTSPVHSGSDSVSVQITDNTYLGLQIYHPDINSAFYSSINFWLNGGPTGGQQLQVYGLLEGNAQSPRYILSTLPSGNWVQFTVPLSALGVANQTNFTGFVIQAIGGPQPTYFVDDISLISNSSPPPV